MIRIKMKYCAQRNCIYFAVCEWNWYSESVYCAAEKRFPHCDEAEREKNGDPSNWFIGTKVVFNLSLALLSMNIIDPIYYYHCKPEYSEAAHPRAAGLVFNTYIVISPATINLWFTIPPSNFIFIQFNTLRFWHNSTWIPRISSGMNGD